MEVFIITATMVVMGVVMWILTRLLLATSVMLLLMSMPTMVMLKMTGVIMYDDFDAEFDYGVYDDWRG